MKECSIYYPGFLPCLSWVKASILYADELLSVFPTTVYWEQLLAEESVPTDNRYLKNYYKRLNCLRYLHQIEIFKPLIASDYLTEETRQRFDDEYALLETAMQSGASQRLLLQWFDKFAPITFHYTPQPLDYQASWRNYVETVNALEADPIAYEVATNNLFDRSLWYLSRLVREDVMIKGKQLIPSTCRSEYHEFVFQTGPTPVPAVNLIVDNCWPVPEANVHPEQILEFKLKYRDDFQELQKTLKVFEHSLGGEWLEQGVGELLLELETVLFEHLRTITRNMKREGVHMRTATYTATFSMESSPNLSAFEVLRQYNGAIVFQQQGVKRRAVRLQKTQVARPSSGSRKLGSYELARVLSFG